MRQRGAMARAGAVLGALMCALAGCAMDPAAEPLASIEDRAYVSSGAVWWTTSIPVCWDNPSAENATERAWVEDSVARTWEAVSAVDFTGWGACAADAPGVHIQILDTRAATRGLGRRLSGVAGGMQLNFTFNNWNTGCRGDARERCIRVDAVHEFGHALGFSHEQNRPDTPERCTDAPQGENGDLVLGAFDDGSVMSYCTGAYDTRAWPWIMSEGDTRAVQLLYGGKPGSFVDSLGGNCLTSVTALPREGEEGSPDGRVELHDCGGAGMRVPTTSGAGSSTTVEVAAQAWDGRPVAAEALASVLHGGGAGERCLDVDGGSGENGTAARLTGCIGGRSQQWGMSDKAIVGLAGKCLDVKWGTTGAAAGLWLYSCNQSSAQRFTVSGGRVVRVADGSCLTALGEGTVEMRPCAAGATDPQQAWTFAPGGQLRAEDSGRCLEVADGSTTDGDAPVQLGTCVAGATYQKWSVRGKVRTWNGKCLAVAGWGTGNGTKAQLWECIGDDPAQEWTFYP